MPLSRREFLKQVAFVSGAAWLSSCNIKTSQLDPIPSKEAKMTSEAQLLSYDLEPVYAKIFKIDKKYTRTRKRQTLFIEHTPNDHSVSGIGSKYVRDEQ